jgi:hypothetical protein
MDRKNIIVTMILYKWYNELLNYYYYEIEIYCWYKVSIIIQLIDLISSINHSEYDR